MDRELVAANGLRFHTIHNGRKGKPLVLFLHGWPEFSGKWTRYVERMPADFFAVAPDLRGFHRSDKPAEISAYALPHLVADVKALIASLGYRSATLIGHDWGGVIAFALAELWPESVEKLVIMNAPHPKVYAELLASPQSGQREAASYMAMLTSPGAATRLLADNCAFLKRALFESSTYDFTDAEKAAYVEAWTAPGAMEASLRYYAALMKNDEAGTQGKGIGQTPTLLLWGVRDTALVRANVDGIERRVTSLEKIVLYPSATHWLSHEKESDILHEIRQFLQEAQPPAPRSLR